MFRVWLTLTNTPFFSGFFVITQHMSSDFRKCMSLMTVPFGPCIGVVLSPETILQPSFSLLPLASPNSTSPMRDAS